MIGALLSDLWPYLAGLGAIIAGLLGWRRSIRQGVKAERAEATILAERLRNERDDEIQQDADLVGRAKSIPGFMRPDAKP